MALDKTKLYKVAGANPGLWIYTSTADAVAAVAASGYFNNATNELKQNDVIVFVDVGTGVDVLVVTSATGAATVTTVNGT